MNRLSLKQMTILLATLAASLTLAGCSVGKGDAAAGERIHEVCLSCHGTELYVSSRRKIESLSALHREVTRWGDYYNPALSEQDVNDVTAYLNTAFYKF
ncbi:MAG TPA: hypothetical protein VFY78_02605 [Gammaproteobacteria bacterium]|nr:hypothetical protein [Gammaproteobacteria bacterium]